MSKFNPDFSRYKLVVLDYNGDSWSEKTKKDFLNYVSNGGGVVIYMLLIIHFLIGRSIMKFAGLAAGGTVMKSQVPYVYYKQMY